MADKLGIDLQQTECTYKGECSGTCPKCKQEEEKLNKALLTKTLAVASISLALTGCSISNSDNDIAGLIEQPLNNDTVIEESTQIDSDNDTLSGDVSIIEE